MGQSFIEAVILFGVLVALFGFAEFLAWLGRVVPVLVPLVLFLFMWLLVYILQ